MPKTGPAIMEQDIGVAVVHLTQQIQVYPIAQYSYDDLLTGTRTQSNLIKAPSIHQDNSPGPHYSWQS